MVNSYSPYNNNIVPVSIQMILQTYIMYISVSFEKKIVKFYILERKTLGVLHLILNL